MTGARPHDQDRDGVATAQPRAYTGERLLTIDEVCAHLRVSRWTFYQLVNSGELSTVKIRRRRLVAVAALSDYVRRLTDEDASV